MKKFLSMVLAALVLTLGMAVTASEAEAQHRRKGFSKRPGVVVVAPRRGAPGRHYVHRRSNRGRNVAIGVGAAILGGIILNEAARANTYRDDGLSCGQLARRCDDGLDWACRKFERRGC